MSTSLRCSCWGKRERRVIWLGGLNIGDNQMVCRGCFDKLRECHNERVKHLGKYTPQTRIIVEWDELELLEEETR